MGVSTERSPGSTTKGRGGFERILDSHAERAATMSGERRQSPKDVGRLSVDAYLERYADRSGRRELVEGRVVELAAERVRHTRTKARVWAELRRAVRAAGVDCEAFADGITVRIDEHDACEPDALVNCGKAPDDDALEAPSPVVVVEVVSPSSVERDSVGKLDAYFRVPSIRHYLVVTTDGRRVVHFERDPSGAPRATIVPSDAALVLDPPGIEVRVASFFTDD